MTGVLRLDALGALTGRGVRVAIIDSGVHAAHPHVQGVAGGIGIDEEGREHADVVDRLGHGTAVAAVIREKAPSAELLAVKVFDRTLAATALALCRALEWAARSGAWLINLSLGTSNPAHEADLERALAIARQEGAIVIAAAPRNAVRWLPGSLAGVVSVTLDWNMPRDACAVEVDGDGSVRVRASGYPRPIPGIPPERNLMGVSFAVANATGLLARGVEGQPGGAAVADLVSAVLRSAAE